MEKQQSNLEKERKGIWMLCCLKWNGIRNGLSNWRNGTRLEALRFITFPLLEASFDKAKEITTD